ncbi:MAG TPA: agmatine deiminase family protein, partial [Phycisphaerae bacterium]
PLFIRCDKKTRLGNAPNAPRGTLALVDFKFNAWARYANAAHDDKIPQTLAKLLQLHPFTAYGENDRREWQRFVLEGGSIDVNGAGCLLTTEECLLSKVQQRNPGFSRERIQNTLAEFLGIQKVLWLDRGIAGDDTHGHVDDIARFVNPTTIVCCTESDRHDVNFSALKENRKRLSAMRDVRGRQFNIVELPMPDPIYFDGQRLPASYANFYIANAAVLVPVFNDVHDALALKVIEGCFKDRPIVPVYCRDLVWGLGTIHCMTQQQPG